MPAATSTTPNIAFCGLGAMGGGMAKALLNQQVPLKVFDVWAPSLKLIASHSPLATPCSTPAEVVKDVDFVALMVVNQYQVEDFFLGSGEACKSMKDGATIIIFSTVEPEFIVNFEKKIVALGKGFSVVDAPVSGGAARAAAGTLSVMASASKTAIEAAMPILQGVTQAPVGKLYAFDTGVGDGSRYKMVHQVLAAIHIASTNEAMAFAATLGLSTKQVYNVIKKSSGWSWMFENRGPRVLDPSLPNVSAITIILKDAGIITSTARLTPFAAPLASLAEQLYIGAKGNGIGGLDDSCVVKVYQMLGAKETSEAATGPGSDSSEFAENGEGDSRKLWLVNQLLAAMHVASAAEAMAFAAALGMNAPKVVEIVLAAAGSSASFLATTPKFQTSDFTPISSDTTVDSYTAGLTQVLEESRKIGMPLFLGSSAHQTFLMAKAAGWGKEDGSAVVKVWETLMKISTAEKK